MIFESEEEESDRASSWEWGIWVEKCGWPRVQNIWIYVLWRGKGRGRNEDKRGAWDEWKGECVCETGLPYAKSSESNFEVAAGLIKWIPGMRRPFELGQDIVKLFKPTHLLVLSSKLTSLAQSHLKLPQKRVWITPKLERISTSSVISTHWNLIQSPHTY